jgi:PPOX class probable F420-dependent enzyme
MPRTKLSEKAIKLIDGKNFGNLAFVMADGSPHVSPVWVDREGDLILVNTAEGRAKAKYLKANHRVALSIFDQQNPYEKVLIKGRVVDMTKKGAEEHNRKISLKYLGTSDNPHRQSGVGRILVKIEPERVVNE